MMPDSTGPQDAVQATEEVVGQAAEDVTSRVTETEEAARQVTDTLRASAVDAAEDLQHATASVAEGAEAANRDGAKAAAAASRAGADAIGEARERLNAMANSLPGPAQDALRPFRAGSESLGRGVESSYATAMEGMAEFNSKAIAAWRNNAESTIRHWQNLATVKSLSEAISLSAEHTRRQLEAVTSQTRELSALATRIVRDAADPLKCTGR